MKAGVSILWVVLLAACLVLPGVVGCSHSGSPTDPVDQNPPGDTQDDPPMGTSDGKMPAHDAPLPGEDLTLG